MALYENTKGSPTSSAVARYLKNVRQFDPKGSAVLDYVKSDEDDKDVRELASKLSPATKSKLDKDWFKDVTSIQDAANKAMSELVTTDPSAAAEIRKLAAAIRSRSDKGIAITKQRRGLLAARQSIAATQLTEAQKAAKQPIDAATRLAQVIAANMRRFKATQKAPIVSLATRAATITPETPTKVT